MTRNRLCLRTALFALTAATLSVSVAQASGRRDHALDANGNLNALIAKHAAANNVPEDLVRRVIRRESGGNARAVSKGNFGLMQIRLQTARGLGYSGSAAGLLDADTNMTYAVKYLAGAYRVAGGNHAQAVRYYAAGYYYAAKRKGVSTQASVNSVAGFKAVASADESPRAAAAAVASNETVGAAVDAEEKVEDARDRGESVSSASDMFSGRLDVH